MFTNSILYSKSYLFSIRMVRAYQHLRSEQKEFILSKQLLRSGTSVAANIAEAHGAISEAEFSAKLGIAYKEILETKYWLSLLHDTEFISKEAFDSVYANAEELSKMLFSALKKTRINKSSKTTTS